MRKYTFSEIFSEIKNFKKELAIANIVAILAALVAAPAPLLIPLLVDEVLLHKPGFLVEKIDWFFSGSHEAWFYVLIVLLVTLLLRAIHFVLNVIQIWYFTVISKHITNKIRKDLLAHIERVSLKEFENFGSGKIASMSIVDVNTIDSFLSSSISKLVISVFMIIAVSVVLLLIHWQLALFILIFNPFMIVFTRKIARNVSKYKKKENEVIAIFQESLSETLDLFRQVRAANTEQYFFDKLRCLVDEIKEKGILFSFKSQMAMGGSYLIFLAGFELFRASGILMVAYSDLTIGLMLAIFGYLWVMVTPINQIITIQYSYHNARAALERINDIFALEQEPQYPHQKNPFQASRANSVVLKDVSFAYQKELPILDGLSLKIDAGKKVALVGASGNGKSTVAQLIVGFYQPDSGDILYDGVSFKEIGLDVVRAHVYLVLQHPMLFNETIRFNLTFGKEVDDASEDLRSTQNSADGGVCQNASRRARYGGRYQRCEAFGWTKTAYLHSKDDFGGSEYRHFRRVHIGTGCTYRREALYGTGAVLAKPYHGDHRPSSQHYRNGGLYLYDRRGQSFTRRYT